MDTGGQGVTDCALILSLFATTEKKLGNLVNENYSLKRDFAAALTENGLSCEKLKVLCKENECLRKLLSNYETSIKSWKKLEDENTFLKSALPQKEKVYEEKVENTRRTLLLEKEVAQKEALKQLSDTRDELSRASADNKKLQALIEEIQQQQSKASAEMKLEYEKKLVKLESEIAAGSRKAVGSSTSMSCGIADDSSRLYISFQKKLEHMKNEYEQTIAKLRSEVESLQKKTGSQVESDQTKKNISHTSTPRLVGSSIAGLKRSSFGGESLNQLKARTIHLPPPPEMPSSFGNRITPPSKKPYEPSPSNAQDNGAKSQQQNKTGATKRVSFANEVDCDVYTFDE